MARLGSVLGAILADLGRARLVADELTKGLVDEYRQDPILASMSVPRVVMDEASLTLRFTVSSLEEPPEPELNPRDVREAWTRHAGRRVLPSVLDRLGVAPADRAGVLEAIERTAGKTVGAPPLTDVRRAIAGDPAPTVSRTAEPLLEAWSDLPSEVRSTLGTKAAFRRELERGLQEELAPFLDRQQELALVRTALLSKVEVAVGPQELPEEPERVQELRITVRGQDVDVLLEAVEG